MWDKGGEDVESMVAIRKDDGILAPSSVIPVFPSSNFTLSRRVSVIATDKCDQ